MGLALPSSIRLWHEDWAGKAHMHQLAGRDLSISSAISISKPSLYQHSRGQGPSERHNIESYYLASSR